MKIGHFGDVLTSQSLGILVVLKTRKPRKGAVVIAASMHGFAVGSSKAP